MSSQSIEQYLRGELTRPTTAEERVEAARRNQEMRRDLAAKLLSIPAAGKLVAGWRASVAANESGFSLPKTLEKKDFRDLFPVLEDAIAKLRSSSIGQRNQGKADVRKLMRELIIDAKRLDETIDFLEDAHERYRVEEAKVEATLFRQRLPSGISDKMLSRGDARQGDLFGLTPALAVLRTLRSEIGMPLAKLKETLDEAKALMKEYLRRREEFYSRNARALAKTIRQRARACGMSKIEINSHFDELFHVVMADCLPALDRFDADCGTVATFMAFRIQGAIRVWLQGQRNAVHIDEKTAKMQGRYRRERARFESLGLDIPDDYEMADLLGMEFDRFMDMRRAMEFTASLDAPVASGEEGESDTLGNSLASNEESPEEALMNPELANRVRAVMERVLPAQQRRVLMRSMGLNGDPWSRQQIAEQEPHINGKILSQERVGQIKKDAMKTLLRDPEFMELRSAISHRPDEDDAQPLPWSDWVSGFRRWILDPLDFSLVEDVKGKITHITEPDDLAWPHEDEDEAWRVGASTSPVVVVRASTLRRGRVLDTTRVLEAA